MNDEKLRLQHDIYEEAKKLHGSALRLQRAFNRHKNGENGLEEDIANYWLKVERDRLSVQSLYVKAEKQISRH